MIDLVSTLLRKNKTVKDKLELLYQVLSAIVSVSIYHTVGGSIALSDSVLAIGGVLVYHRFYNCWFSLPIGLVLGVYITEIYRYNRCHTRGSKVLSSSLAVVKLLLRLTLTYDCSQLVVLNTGSTLKLLIPCRKLVVTGATSYTELSKLYRLPGLSRFLSTMPRIYSLVWTSSDVNRATIIWKFTSYIIVFSRSLKGDRLHFYTLARRHIYTGRYGKLCFWNCPNVCSNPRLVQFIGGLVYSYSFLHAYTTIKETLSETNIRKNRT